MRCAMSRERPILFSSPMVRALLDGSKTQTRRVVKPQPYRDDYMADGDVRRQFATLSPYGQPGDRLWVRETWRTDATLDRRAPSDFAGWPVKYEADGAVLSHGAHFGNTDGKTRVSIHMPRWASRILLEITGVRVERLHDISDADIEAEGIDMVALAEAQERYDVIAKDGNASGRPTLRSAWRDLWESTGGDWDANPWLWAISFRRVTP